MKAGEVVRDNIECFEKIAFEKTEQKETGMIRASVTVEASLVVPFLCLLLAVLLQVIFYLHDVSIFASTAYEAAQKAADLEGASQKEKQDYAKEQAQVLLQGKRLACSAYQVEAKATSKKVLVYINGNSGFLRGVSIEVQKEVTCENPVEYLRNWKKLNGLWKTIDGEEE